jgi:hypothetical protein
VFLIFGYITFVVPHVVRDETYLFGRNEVTEKVRMFGKEGEPELGAFDIP